ncbi:MAG: hypothetical protein NZ570_00275 [Candidatus Caldarchaeum sp.]|nr:hypothetical protein [Candidatus Caldarchaeum sp.]MCS7137228.1 hypothetical protein [Candidatus Caldarchaeum sp.]MDW7977348.1 hypothetical protein [Candidatus Caldarchaeum sp.]MDW8359679.1 hypothetical protein [Candidatus Caldarchaeum sp.]
MKTFYAAASAVAILASASLIFGENRAVLLPAAAAAALIASTTVLQNLAALRRPAGWSESRYTLLTLGTLSASCFASTIATIYTNPPTHYIILLAAVNTYILARVVAEALAYRRSDGALASAALLLGLLSYLVYLVSVWEALSR